MRALLINTLPKEFKQDNIEHLKSYLVILMFIIQIFGV